MVNVDATKEFFLRRKDWTWRNLARFMNTIQRHATLPNYLNPEQRIVQKV